MKLSLSIAAALLLVCARTSSAQFGHVYGDASMNEEGYGIELTADGGFVVGGNVFDTTSVNPRGYYWAAKFDVTGKKIWDKRFGISDTALFWSIRTTHDNGILLAGLNDRQYSGRESALMFKVDSNGNIVWTTNIDYARADHAHWLAENKSGGYYFAGHTDSKGDIQGDMWCGKLDAGGKLVWDSVYDWGGGEHVHAATVTVDNGICMLGHRDINGYEKFAVVRVDSNGKEQWRNTYSSAANKHDSPYFIQNTRNGGFALIGFSENATGSLVQMWLVVIDSLGNKLFDKHFGTGQSYGWSGRQTSDGGFVLAGYTNNKVPGGFGMYVVKTDSIGNLQWEKTYGGSGFDGAYNIVQRDSNYIIAGFTNSFTLDGTQNDEDVWIVYTDAKGNVVDTLDRYPAVATDVAENSAILPTRITLEGIYPNPLHDHATMRFDLPSDMNVSITIVDALGNEVATIINGAVSRGRHAIEIGATMSKLALPSGMYFVELKTASGERVAAPVGRW